MQTEWPRYFELYFSYFIFRVWWLAATLINNIDNHFKSESKKDACKHSSYCQVLYKEYKYIYLYLIINYSNLTMHDIKVNFKNLRKFYAP